MSAVHGSQWVTVGPHSDVTASFYPWVACPLLKRAATFIAGIMESPSEMARNDKKPQPLIGDPKNAHALHALEKLMLLKPKPAK